GCAARGDRWRRRPAGRARLRVRAQARDGALRAPATGGGGPRRGPPGRHRPAAAIRRGGRPVAGRSSPEGIVLDVTPMRSVAVAGEVATVGAGVRLGSLYDALAEQGLTIPAGCGPSVGIAGLTLGGGLGILGRKHGLTCDHLLG